MIPVPTIAEAAAGPAVRWAAPPDLPTPHDPSGGEFGLGALLRFKSLMAHEGQEVHLARMCWDRLYAYERFAAAHATGGAPLQALALELFQIWHRRGAAGCVPQ